jgi:hypothetical protein
VSDRRELDKAWSVAGDLYRLLQECWIWTPPPLQGRIFEAAKLMPPAILAQFDREEQRSEEDQMADAEGWRTPL